MSVFEAPIKPATKPKRKADEEPADPETSFTAINPPEKKKFRGGHGLQKIKTDLAQKYGLPAPTSPIRSLTDQHIITLTALLHRSLLQRDFKRASRAFGLLLRTNNGKRFDIRRIWEIGLTILQNREEGPKKRIEYLDILTVTYPFRAGRYYPQGMGLWNGDIELQQNTRGVVGRGKAGLYPNASEFHIKSFEEQVLDPEESMERVLDRLRELMLMPPWSDDVRLWLLRGMVGLCKADTERAEIEGIAVEQRKEWEMQLGEMSSQSGFSQGEGRTWMAWRTGLKDVRDSFLEVEKRKETINQVAWDGLEKLERLYRGTTDDSSSVGDTTATTAANTTIADTTMGETTFSTVLSNED